MYIYDKKKAKKVDNIVFSIYFFIKKTTTDRHTDVTRVRIEHNCEIKKPIRQIVIREESWRKKS
jgi:hypothetical protein